MARCSDCGLEMTTADGCTAADSFSDFSDGTTRKRIRYGDEGRAEFTKFAKGDARRGAERCHDCGVRPGQYHHSGCDVEECPKCHAQAISCMCTDEERV